MCSVASAANVTEGESIQAALDNASWCERINVSAGTYIENLHITTPVQMQGDGVILIAEVAYSPAVEVLANCTKVSGFDISGSRWGVRLVDVNNANITGNTVHHNEINIQARSINNSWIARNTVNNAEDTGIDIIASTNLSVFENVVYENGGAGGIVLYMSDNLSVHDNRIHSNVCVYGGLTVYSSDHSMIGWNQMWNNTKGIHLRYSRENMMWNNIFADGGDAHGTDYNNTWCTSELHMGPNVVGGAYSSGNYWNDYTGVDNNNDGLGDTPYSIAGTTDQDLRPLVSPKCSDCDFNGYTSANNVIEAYRKAVDPSYDIQYEWVVDVDGNGYISANDVVEIYRKAVDPTYQLHCSLTI
jgi:parallel beta-helix repeat protein